MKGTDLKSTQDQALDKLQKDRIHATCKEWRSELLFWRDEIDFLKKLILNYAFHLEHQTDINKLKYQVNKLGGDLEQELKNITNKVEILDCLLNEDCISLETRDLLTESDVLRLRINYFREEYQDTKDEILSLLKSVFKHADDEVIRNIS